MTAAFQSTAFQNNAFQIDQTGGTAFDGGGIALTRGALKRLRRKAEDERKRREAGWESGLLASKELIEQIARAMEPEKIRSLPVREISDDDEDDEEAILMLMMS